MECDTEFVVKQESYYAEDMTSQKEYSDILPEPSAKCGEVFLGYGGGFILVCGMCSSHFRNFELFGGHIHDTHLNLNSSIDSSCDGELCVDIHNDPLRSSPVTGNRIPKQEELSSDLHDQMKLEVMRLSPECLLEQMQEDEDKQNETLTSINFTESTERRSVFTCDLCDCSYVYRKSYLAHVKKHEVKTKRLKNKLRRQIRKKPIDNSKNALSVSDAMIRTTDEEPAVHSLNGESKMTSMLAAKNLSEEEYRCILCQRKYKHKKSLLSHIRTEHRNKAPNTQSRLGGPADDGNEQSSLESNQKHTCNICSRMYRHRKSLRAHMRNGHCENTLQISVDENVCKFCDKKLNSQDALETHISNDHPDDRKFVCPHCPKTFKCRASRKRHINSHTGERIFECPHCPLIFYNSTNLAAHVRKHLQIKSHCCSFCSKSFAAKCTKDLHEMTHTGEKPHQCEECGKRYVSAGKLTEHQRRHKNIRNHKCDICSKRFYTWTILKDHKMSHSSERPFSCNVCGQNFPRKRALRVHEQLHSAVKKYVCNTCGKSFAQCAGLYSHKKSHEEIK